MLPQCQAVQDVEKAVSLFESTGRISATVMEARYSARLSAHLYITVYEGPLNVCHVENVKIELELWTGY